jgi:maleylpyruvate isomerase
VDISRWPRIAAIDAACARLEAFSNAAPAAQPDAV